MVKIAGVRSKIGSLLISVIHVGLHGFKINDYYGCNPNG